MNTYKVRSRDSSRNAGLVILRRKRRSGDIVSVGVIGAKGLNGLGSGKCKRGTLHKYNMLALIVMIHQRNQETRKHTSSAATAALAAFEFFRGRKIWGSGISLSLASLFSRLFLLRVISSFCFPGILKI